MAYKSTIEQHNADLQDILTTVNELPDASSGVEINAITASALPATVVDGQIVVITDTAASTIYVDTDEPANPVEGDVWIVVGTSETGIQFDSTFRNGLSEALQYNGSAWATLDGHIGASGVWEQFSVIIPTAGTPLEDWTWQQIGALVNSDKDVTEYFAVGDTKEIELTTGEIVTAVIGAFHHNTITDSAKTAALAFTFKDCLATKYAINTSQTNVGGWKDSNFRNNIAPTILETFPSELVAIMKNVDVITTAGNKATTLVTTSDKIRLHSWKELGITNADYAYVDGGTTYDYYAAGNRIKQVNGGNQSYWTRTPATNLNTTFCFVNAAGAGSVYNPTNAMGIPLAFDI